MKRPTIVLLLIATFGVPVAGADTRAAADTADTLATLDPNAAFLLEIPPGSFT